MLLYKVIGSLYSCLRGSIDLHILLLVVCMNRKFGYVYFQLAIYGNVPFVEMMKIDLK